MREASPETYAEWLAQAKGTEAEEFARRDPEAWVALRLADWADYRAVAARMREEEPEIYARALAEAEGTVAKESLRRHPDEYVGLVLRKWEQERSEEAGAEGG
jgi:hypothetical protein